MTDTKQQTRFYGTGRRKEAVARVWLCEGQTKAFVVNREPFEKYFNRETLKMIVNEPLQLTSTNDRFDILATVTGGGPAGQAGALRLGIARALLQYDDNLRSPLRKGGVLTRDPREKERKKYGRKGARRSFQFTKR